MSDVTVKARLAKVVNVVGSVYAIGPLEVVINQEACYGVKPGDKFLVFGTGPHIIDPETGEDLGALELVRGRGEVVHVPELMATIRGTKQRRTRPAKRVLREPGRSLGFGILGPSTSVIEEELAPETEISFEAVQVGDLAKPV